MGKTRGNGNLIADGSSSEKPNVDGDVSSSNRKRKHTSLPSLPDSKITGKTKGKVADKGNGIADGSPSTKRNGDGDDRSGKRKRERDSLYIYDCVAVEEASRNNDNEVFDIHKIKVKMPSGKIKSFKVDGSHTVGSLKVKIQAKTGIFFDKQELIFNEKALENMDTFANLPLNKESVLTLMNRSYGLIRIFIKTPEGEITDALYAQPSDTIRKIKDRISTDRTSEVLIFNETVLEDFCTLAAFDIVDGSSLINIAKSEGLMKIFVKMYTGKTLSLMVKPNYCIFSVKLMIRTCEEIPFEDQVFIFNDTVLGDNGILRDFGITRNSTLTLMHRPWEYTRSIRIFIKTLNGETITQEVNPSDTIGDVKAKIKDKVNVPRDEQELMFNGIVLFDMDTVAVFHIKEESTLTLLHKPRGFKSFMRIFIKTHTGETITAKVSPSDTIGALKAKIKDKVDVPCEEQELIFNDMVMSDVDTLADFHVNEESTLTLMRISSGLMRIFVKVRSGNTIALDVGLSNTVRDVRMKVFDKGQLPPHEKNCRWLFFDGILMEENATLADYNITEESTLRLKRGEIAR